MPGFMKNAAQTRVLAIVLALATVAVCVLAAMNFEHENGLEVPTDGVWWVEANGGLKAERVPSSSPGHRAGIRTGDILVSVNDRPTPRVASLGREMFHSGIWAHATYSILRPVPQSVDQSGTAVYRARLPLHRDLCPVPALDRPEIHSLLCLLPGLFCAVRLQINGRAKLGRLGQYGGAGVTAGPLPALRRQ